MSFVPHGRHLFDMDKEKIEIMKIFLTIIFLAVCVALVVIVLMQEGKSAGLGSIGGIGESYWGKNKSRSMEGNLVKFTKILAAAFLIIALALNMIPDKTTVTTSTLPAETEALSEAAETVLTEAAAAATEAEQALAETEA